MPTPRTALSRTDPLEPKDKNARGQGPRTQCRGSCSPKKKRSLKSFSGDLKKRKGLQKFFSGDLQLRKTNKGRRKFSARFMAFSNKISTVQKIVLSSSRGQGNFEDLRPGQGLDLRGPTPRTSKWVLQAKDVLEDSTSGLNHFQSYSNLFSQVDHLPIITSGICIKYLLKIAPIPNGTS